MCLDREKQPFASPLPQMRLIKESKINKGRPSSKSKLVFLVIREHRSFKEQTTFH